MIFDIHAHFGESKFADRVITAKTILSIMDASGIRNKDEILRRRFRSFLAENGLLPGSIVLRLRKLTKIQTELPSYCRTLLVRRRATELAS